jgi:hypothetical protein
MKFGKYYRALDHVIVAMNSMGAGKPVLAAKHLQQAMQCKDFEQVIALLDEANDVKAPAKPTLAQALTIVAAKAKPKKKAGSKKPFGGKQAPPFKKKTKANTLEISEVDLDGEDGLTEDDLLLDDDAVDTADVGVDDGSGDEDLDLDSLSLDDDAEEMADFDLDDVMEMPEATSAEAVGTDAEIKPGKDGTPPAQDVSETDTQPKSGVDAESQIAKTKGQLASKKATTAAARRLLSNLSVLERQSAIAQAKVQAKK